MHNLDISQVLAFQKPWEAT